MSALTVPISSELFCRRANAQVAVNAAAAVALGTFNFHEHLVIAVALNDELFDIPSQASR